MAVAWRAIKREREKEQKVSLIGASPFERRNDTFGAEKILEKPALVAQKQCCNLHFLNEKNVIERKERLRTCGQWKRHHQDVTRF